MVNLLELVKVYVTHGTDFILFYQIGRGLIAYVCFMKGSTSETVSKMGKLDYHLRLIFTIPQYGMMVSEYTVSYFMPVQGTVNTIVHWCWR